MATSRRQKLRRRKAGRKLLLFLLGLTAVYFFLNSSFFALEDIRVEGAKKVKEEEVRLLAGLQPGTNLWRLETGEPLRRLAAHALIDSVSIDRLWPRGVTIRITEREALSLVSAAGSGYLVLDAKGYIMQRVEKLGQIHLPLVTGVKAPSEGALGTKISLSSLQAALNALAAMPAVDRVRVLEINCAQLENMRLYLAGNIEVKFGDNSRVKEKMASIREILTQIGHQQAIAYIDVSFAGPPVIKYRP